MNVIARRLMVVMAMIGWACPMSAEGAERPNIVLIISDDHAWTDYGFMGHPEIRTPHLDRLAGESLCFRRGYVPSSLCCPSLATILTGLYPHQHKVTSNDPPIPAGMTNREFQGSAAFKEGREAMNRHLEAVPTLPRMLQEHGYLSFQSGKWWQGNFRRGGFTHGMTTGQRHGDAGLDIGRKTLEPIVRFVDMAIEQKQPFLVWYAPMMPHDPHTPPERILKRYLDKTPSPHVAKYWAMVEWFDETCGELLQTLEDRGVADNTIVVYVADNGWIQNPDKPGFLPSKRSPYDSGLRTPILIRWPKTVVPAMVDDPVMSIDIVPTLCAAVGQTRTNAMQGVNLLDREAVSMRASVQGACFTHNAVDLQDPSQNVMERWMIAEGWKLILPSERSELKTAQLFRIADDAAERNEVSGNHPEIVTRMRTALDQWWLPE